MGTSGLWEIYEPPAVVDHGGLRDLTAVTQPLFSGAGDQGAMSHDLAFSGGPGGGPGGGQGGGGGNGGGHGGGNGGGHGGGNGGSHGQGGGHGHGGGPPPRP